MLLAVTVNKRSQQSNRTITHHTTLPPSTSGDRTTTEAWKPRVRTLSASFFDTSSMDTILFVLGDQLDRELPEKLGFSPERTTLVMAEVESEIFRYPNHKQRVILFLAAMRHYRDDMRSRGWKVSYLSWPGEADAEELGGNPPLDLIGAWMPWLEQCHSQEVTVHMVEPGRKSLKDALSPWQENIQFHEDPRFLCTADSFSDWARGKKRLTLEYFYRTMRRQHHVLMDGDMPVGNAWNFDHDNRKSFSKAGPGLLPTPPALRDRSHVNNLVHQLHTNERLWGNASPFHWPVTPRDAEVLLEHFLSACLAQFGDYQDAMWTSGGMLYHSGIASAINLGLLDPLHVIRRAEDSYWAKKAPLSSVEGFIRQILGWREFMRGVYALYPADYAQLNASSAHHALPSFFWDGDTDMTCLQQVVIQLRETGYAHHIQRLMVTGLFAQLFGVKPSLIYEWFVATHIDSVEWVTAPNVLGMSQYADGGIVATKPYIASGKYIERMSNYCTTCKYNAGEATGDSACPFTTLYWNYLIEHEESLRSSPRMRMQLRNLDRKTVAETEAIVAQANTLRTSITSQ